MSAACKAHRTPAAAEKSAARRISRFAIAIDLFKRTPEETADRLMEVSSKAQENGEGYALDQAMNAARKVAGNPRSTSR